MPGKQDSLTTLARIAQILQKSQPLENPLAHIVMMVRDQLSVDVCSLYLLEDKKLVLVATDGLDPSSVGKVRMGVHEGLTGLAVEKLQPVIVNEASLHPRFKYFPETGEEKFHSFVALPLIETGNVVGVLTLQTIQPRQFEMQEIELLKLVAFQLSGVIRNLVLLEVLQVEVAREKHPARHTGIAVAPGFGVGPAFFLRSQASPLSRPPTAVSTEVTTVSTTLEWKKLQRAIRKAVHDLKHLERRLEGKFSRSELDIFSSHRMILADRSFLRRLKAVIEKDHGRATAADAVRDVFGDYVREFEKSSDPYFREKAADLEDLAGRILDQLEGRRRKVLLKEEGILIAETLVPSDTTRLDPEKIRGIVTMRGGVTSHAAILARSLGIPAVMGVAGVTAKIAAGDVVIVDGNLGTVFVNPAKPILQEYERVQERYADRIVHLQRLKDRPAVTRDGRRIYLEANIGLISGLKNLKQFGAEGVGLYRTEFPFMVRKKLPTEEEQYEIYKKVLDEAEGLPVTFRLLDAGGDKPIESLGLQKEANPFLGYRSIRLTLSRPELLKSQLRALLRVSAHGLIQLLVPMVSGVEEIRAVKVFLEEARQDLRLKGVPYRDNIPLGIMIEVPSAVWMARFLAKDADFFSVGTNDLIQYTLAVDRNNESVAQFFEPFHPAVLTAIGQTVVQAETCGKPVSVCGETAGDPRMVPLLVGLGVTHLSMIPSNIPLVKETILNLDFSAASELARKALLAGTVEEVKGLLTPPKGV